MTAYISKTCYLLTDKLQKLTVMPHFMMVIVFDGQQQCVVRIEVSSKSVHGSCQTMVVFWPSVSIRFTDTY